MFSFSPGTLFLLLLLSVTPFWATAQDVKTPITSQELVKMVYELPRHPERLNTVVQEIRDRGIGFPLTDGMRSVVASKSGSDPLLRRTLEEAERRRANPAGTSTLPPEREANELLEKTRAATVAAVDGMPDFMVRQEISRARAFGNTSNWQNQDKLTMAVGYRAAAGEEYKLLAVNGVPMGSQDEGPVKSDYMEKLGGTQSTGEYVTMLADLFRVDAQTEFKAVDTDLLRSRPTIVYEFVIKRDNSRLTLSYRGLTSQSTTTGLQGRIWVDRELGRILRYEGMSTEIPAGFPISAASSAIDYAWVPIVDQKYLLPSRAEIKLTETLGGSVSTGRVLGSQQVMRVNSAQSRNVIRFKDYQKYGTEVKIIDDVEPDEDIPPQKP